MAVQDDDKFIVNRGGTDYKVSASDLDDKLKDDDQVLINRGGTDYKVSGADLREYLGIAKMPWDGVAGIYHVIITDPAAINVSENDKIYNKDTKAEVGSITAPGEYIITGAASFNTSDGNWQFGPLTDTSKVTDMREMFLEANAFNSDISNWDVSNVTSMDYMFHRARAFNQDIGNWDVSNVTSMRSMLLQAKVFNQDLTGWCVTNITSEPMEFKNSSGMPSDGSKDPVWGTCSRGEDKP